MEPGVGSEVWTHWHGHPDALVGLAVLEGAYLLGVGPLRERYNLGKAVASRQVATFTAGVLVIFVALLSPIHELSDNYLFSVHMVQHILLTLVAPPLLILGTPDWLIRPLLRPDLTFWLARLATHPVIAFALFNIIFAVWHTPALYNSTLENHWVHIGQHLLLIATSVAMWWPVSSMMPELPRLSYPYQLVYLFLLSVAQIIVFAVITFAREPIYQWYVNAPRVWNISPLLDQQLGGIIMKVGSSMIFLAIFIVVFFRWFNQDEARRRAEAAERGYPDPYTTGAPAPEDDRP